LQRRRHGWPKRSATNQMMPPVIFCKHGQLKILGEPCDEECGPEFVEDMDRKFLKSIGVKIDETDAH
jgi:hypothetical protein